MKGEFLDSDEKLAAPPLSSLRDLEYAAQQIEDNSNADDPEYLKWLTMLIVSRLFLGGSSPQSQRSR